MSDITQKHAELHQRLEKAKEILKKLAPIMTPGGHITDKVREALQVLEGEKSHAAEKGNIPKDDLKQHS